MDFSQVNNKHLSRVHFSDHVVALQFFFSQIIDLIMNIFLSLRPLGENYANPKTCFFHVLFKAAAWVILGIFSVIRFEAGYVLVVAVCASLSIANIVGFAKCRKDAKKQIQGFACEAIASHFTSTIRSALSAL
ncbi:hypothetical protein POTOM_010725 [Populus tomentosa]|uniref:Golgi apparatus membrane protein TVP23 n=1 Tax=Populus tomentosa TaxID=118781 RepID=A0A8X8AQE9_POPTO|nr:hypothetical protein POTOM_010725 [Populus tomentosa]